MIFNITLATIFVIANLLLFVCGIILYACVFFLIRIENVYYIRSKMLKKNIDLYYKLPEYSSMLNSYFYIWTYKGWLKFINNEAKK